MAIESSLIPGETIIRKIVVLRAERVILDVHLADLYKVETRVLKQAVRRNMERFPADFMFELSEEEMLLMVSQSVIPAKKHFGGALPFAFTEYGVAMLSGVLKSNRAIEMNILIIRTFIMLRKIAANYHALVKRLEEMEMKNEGRFKEIYKVLKYLIDPPVRKARKIGFKQTNREES